MCKSRHKGKRHAIDRPAISDQAQCIPQSRINSLRCQVRPSGGYVLGSVLVKPLLACAPRPDRARTRRRRNRLSEMSKTPRRPPTSTRPIGEMCNARFPAAHLWRLLAERTEVWSQKFVHCTRGWLGIIVMLLRRAEAWGGRRDISGQGSHSAAAQVRFGADALHQP